MEEIYWALCRVPYRAVVNAKLVNTLDCRTGGGFLDTSVAQNLLSHKHTRHVSL